MGKAKAFLALAIIFGGGYLAWELLPPLFHKYEFQDELDDIARRNSYTGRTDDDVRSIVIQKASTLDIPLKENQITITRSSDGLGISVRYRIHVDMILHPVDLDFSADSMNRRI
jgi:hypothetical protein